MSLNIRLACSGFARSLRFYTDVLGFTTMRYMPEQRRAELERDGVCLEIVEGTDDVLGMLSYPFGRGVTLVVWVHDAEAVYSAVQAYGARVHQPMLAVWREEDGAKTGHTAFEVLDPDGYAIRFCEAIR